MKPTPRQRLLKEINRPRTKSLYWHLRHRFRLMMPRRYWNRAIDPQATIKDAIHNF